MTYLLPDGQTECSYCKKQAAEECLIALGLFVAVALVGVVAYIARGL